MIKNEAYEKLVAERKTCHQCRGLTNPVAVDDGLYDSNQIGPWTLWQGDLNASLMVVGQDWGDENYYSKHAGMEGPKNPTNLALIELVRVAGIPISDPGVQESRRDVFLTNAILCLKSGGLQGEVQKSWFKNCAHFLRRQIEIVRPKVVVGLGERAYRSILEEFNVKCRPFRSEVELLEGRLLNNGTRAFAVYHCGARIQNTHRKLDVQKRDWARMQQFLT